MTDISATGGTRRQFTDEDANALLRGESTNHVLQRDLKVSVDIHGRDKTQRELATEQKEHFGAGGLGSLAHAGLEPVVGALHLGPIGLVAEIGLPIVGFGLGWYELHVAKENGKEQAAALTRENVHVGLLGALKLPDGFKAERLAEYSSTGENSTQGFKMTEALMNDPNALATLQHHCDVGMLAGRDFVKSGVSDKAFLASHPKIKASYDNDAAFREGFDAYVFATNPKKGVAAKDLEALDTRLDNANGWTAQTQTQVRG